MVSKELDRTIGSFVYEDSKARINKNLSIQEIEKPED